MIHTINTLNAKQYSLFDRTNKLRYLKRWWNILPTFLFKKKLTALALYIHENLSGTKIEIQFEKEIHRLNSKDKIELLIALYQAAYNLLVNLAYINDWKDVVGIEKTDAKHLKEYTDRIFKYTGYKIACSDDLEMLKNEIERRTEKFAEFFPKIEVDQNKKGATFMQIYMGVLSILNITMHYDMKMVDFFDAKISAYEIIKKQKSNG